MQEAGHNPSISSHKHSHSSLTNGHISTSHPVNTTSYVAEMYLELNVLSCCVRIFFIFWLQNFTTFYGPQLYHFLFSAIYFTTLFHSKEKGPWCTALQKNRTRIIHFVLSCKIDIRNKLQIPDADDGRGDGHHQ